MARIVALACLAISGAMAAVYGYTTGNSEIYGLLRAIGWGIVAIVGGCAPAWFFHHLDNRSYCRASVTALAGVVCFCVTVYGSMGGIAGSGDKVTAERKKVADATKDDRAELKRILADRGRLPEFRPVGTVEADLAVARSGRAYRATDGCNPEKIAGKAARDACDAYRKLEGELEAGKAAARLEGAAQTIRGRLAHGSGAQVADPGATAVSLIVDADAAKVAAWFALFGSIALELAGMIAMMRADSPAVTRNADERAPEQIAINPATGIAPISLARPSARRPRTSTAVVMIEPPNPGEVSEIDTIGRFMLGCLKKSPGEETAGSEIYGRYQAWCGEQRPGLTPLDMRAFAQHFAERCQRIGVRMRCDGSKVLCVGVKLVA